MQRPGADPNDMQVADFLCDFCRRAWDGTFPMVEGHQGSLVCGRCLTAAYTDLVNRRHGTAPAGVTCTMCLEERDEHCWQSPMHEDAVVCTRCCKQAAGRLHKDKDWDWSKPEPG